MQQIFTLVMEGAFMGTANRVLGSFLPGNHNAEESSKAVGGCAGGHPLNESVKFD